MKQGFTLLELSIVLVIIGLIIGGITVGADMIESAELNNVTSDIGKYKTALHSFRLKYNARPGDMDNATAYWGALVGDCKTVAATGTETCDGDGDGGFDYTSASLDDSPESWKAWQHLANAEIIPGRYTGVSTDSICTSANNCSDIGVNVPAAAIDGTGWHLFTFNTSWGRTWTGKNQTRAVLALGNASNEGGGRWFGRALTAQQQHIIDTKLDDGMPYTGDITNMSGTTYSPNCGTTSSNSFSDEDATYNLSFEGQACIMFVDID